METRSILRYSDLTEEQWSRVAKSIERQVTEKTGRDCYVAIGRKYRNDQMYGWQVAARIYVPQKRKRVAKSKMIPPVFYVRLRKEDGGYEELKIRSDVETEFRPTGLKVNPLNATSGYLVLWLDGRGFRRWGLVTVGHIFDSAPLRDVSVRLTSSIVLQCKVKALAPKNGGLDVAILQAMRRQDGTHPETALKDAGLIDVANVSNIQTMSTTSVLRSARRRANGATRPRSGSIPFRCRDDVFPSDFRLGTRMIDRRAIAVEQAQVGVFKVGTSGSRWTIGGTPACMQVGGSRPNFQAGLGQPFALLAPWIRQKLGSTVMLINTF